MSSNINHNICKLTMYISYQGGIFPGSQGARLPRILQAHMKSWQQFMLFWCEFDFKVFPLQWRNSSYHTQHAGIFSCHMKKHLGTWNNLLPQEEISFHRKDFFPRTDISVTGRNFLSQKEDSWHRREFHATVRNFLSQKEISCQRKKFN